VSSPWYKLCVARSRLIRVRYTTPIRPEAWRQIYWAMVSNDTLVSVSAMGCSHTVQLILVDRYQSTIDPLHGVARPRVVERRQKDRHGERGRPHCRCAARIGVVTPFVACEQPDLCEGHNDVASTSLIENWIDQNERRAWFLFEETDAR
jgi:hypothetical protein